MAPLIATALAVAFFQNDVSSCDAFQDARYSELVSAYRAGRFEEAARAMRALEQGVIDRVHRGVRVADSRIFTARPMVFRLSLSTRCRKAAALVHADVVMLAARDGDDRSREFHLEIVRELLTSLELSFERSLRFYLALAHQELFFIGAEPSHLQFAADELRGTLRRFPNDTLLLLASGALLEWSGGLEEARERFEKVSRLDPAFARAKLRYGTILQKMGRWDDSEAPLEAALGLSDEAIIIYRARMALGKRLELQNRNEDAASHYRAAIRAIPTWQVGYVALAHAQHVSGARELSRATLDEAFALELDDDSFHGWWSYETGLIDLAQPTRERLRNEVRF